MLLDQKLSLIREEKARLGICCDLRRRLVHIEVRDMISGVRNTISNVTLGLSVVEQVIRLLRDRKEKRKS